MDTIDSATFAAYDEDGDTLWTLCPDDQPGCSGGTGCPGWEAWRANYPRGAWVVGHNMPGYSPDPDNVHAVAEWQDAWAILLSVMQRAADDDDDAYASIGCGHAEDGSECDSECYGSTRALLDAIVADGMRDGSIDTDTDVSIGLADNDGRVTVWWVQWSPDSEPDND